jgi:hypothetical protein
MAALDDLITARDAMCRVLALESGRRQTNSEAGNPIQVTYSVGGKTVNWTGSLKDLIESIKELNELIAAMDLYEEHQVLYSG